MIHPTAIVQTTDIGANTLIWQFVVILAGAKIGDHCNINCLSGMEGDVVLGDHVTLKPGVFLGNGTRVGNRVFIGPNACFVNDRYPRSRRPLDHHALTVLEEGCSIGAGAIIMNGIRVGRFAMVAAGSVVSKDVPDHALVTGNPARRIGWVDEAGEPLTLEGERWFGPTGEVFERLENGLVKRSH